MRRFSLLILLGFILSACGGTSSPTTPTTPGPTNPTPDSDPVPGDVALTFSDFNLDAGYAALDVTMLNNADITIDSISVDVKLVEGNTVVDSGSAIYTGGLDSGQQTTEDALFFETEDLGTFSCYEYSVQIIVVDESIVEKEDYPGTCG